MKTTRKLSLTFVPGLLLLFLPPDLGVVLPEPSPSCCRARIWGAEWAEQGKTCFPSPPALEFPAASPGGQSRKFHCWVYKLQVLGDCFSRRQFLVFFLSTERGVCLLSIYAEISVIHEFNDSICSTRSIQNSFYFTTGETEASSIKVVIVKIRLIPKEDLTKYKSLCLIFSFSLQKCHLPKQWETNRFYNWKYWAVAEIKEKQWGGEGGKIFNKLWIVF